MTSASFAKLARWRDFFSLTKPRVMSLVVFTGLCGLLLAPMSIHPALGFTAILCIAFGAGGAGSLNQWYEMDIDARMERTAGRPLPAGRMDRQSALHFGIGLSSFSVLLMGLAINVVAASLLALSIFYYVVIYTVWLKRRTPQNIVVGGGAGAFPPLIGWAAVTGDIATFPLLLFALIFLWTPPHFWSLALYVKTDYAKAGIPMLPVVAGELVTRMQIGLYTIPMALVAVAPWVLNLTHWLYGFLALFATAVFCVMAAHVAFRRTQTDDRMIPERQLFRFSIVYQFMIFSALIADRWLVG